MHVFSFRNRCPGPVHKAEHGGLRYTGKRPSSTHHSPPHDDHDPARRPRREHCRRPAIHLVLPPRRLHRPPGPCLRARAKPGRQRRDRADPDQQQDERHRTPSDLPGHRHRQRVPEGRHERAPGRLHRQPGRRHQRRRAPRLQPPRQPAARQRGGRSAVRAQEHQGQHPRRDLHRARARRHGGSDRGRQRRRQRKQKQDDHAQPGRLRGRLGAENRADHGRWLVPAGHAGASASAAPPRRRC
jgi:hypothetical protein